MGKKKDGFGFHCSESSIRAINEALNMHIPEEIFRISTGFRGGGGGYVYDMGTRMVTELLLEAEDLLLEMPKDEMC